MLNPVSIITAIVGIIGCVIGVATFCSAQITKAKQDGVLIEKVDQCVRGINEIKKDMKEKNKEIDLVIDQHTTDIVELKSQVKTIFKMLGKEN
ncbi:MAG: hypothetical protein J6T10_22735 [Methanobrevibacter sp.]|nr:hypothetical protein [Methanobrevibacter sp.]